MKRAAWIQSLRRLAWIAVVFLSAAMIISAVEKKESSLTSTLTIEIEPLPGEHRLITREDVLEKLKLAFGFDLEGRPLEVIDMERLERVLEEESFVQEANAFIDSNNHIKIFIRQRQPVLRVIDHNGLNYYLDRDGLRMPLSDHYSARVIVATGYLPPHNPDFLARKNNTLKSVFELAELIREDPLFDPLIEQIHVDERNQISLVPKVGEQRIFLGRAESMEEKLENLKTFYLEALPFEGWEKYKDIDLRYKGQVVATKS